VSLPLIIIAFYVNPISRKIKRNRKRDFRRIKEKKTDPADEVESDSSDSSDDDSNSPSAKAAKQKRRATGTITDRSSTFLDDSDLDYAPLFGNPKFTWHTKIPIVRRLWEYKIYRLAELENLNAGLEDLDWDYPLSRLRKTAASPVRSFMIWLGLDGLSERYVEHEKNYRGKRQSDELVREFLEAQMELRAQEKEQAKARVRERASAENGGSTPGVGPRFSSVRGSMMRRGARGRAPLGDEEG